MPGDRHEIENALRRVLAGEPAAEVLDPVIGADGRERLRDLVRDHLDGTISEPGSA